MPETPTALQTRNLDLRPQSIDDVRAQVVQMSPDEWPELSAAWRALLDGSAARDPWVQGFALVHRPSGVVVGRAGFTGPPDDENAVELAYGLSPEYQGRGYATEAVEALVAYAFSHPDVNIVRAHTAAHPGAATRVLSKCGFQPVSELLDPEAGLVWRWELLAEIG